MEEAEQAAERDRQQAQIRYDQALEEARNQENDIERDRLEQRRLEKAEDAARYQKIAAEEWQRAARMAQEREQNAQQAGFDVPAANLARGGLIYANNGTFVPRGTDTVPAMLTPGEYVVQKSAVDKMGVDTLNAINNGTLYANDGTLVPEQSMDDRPIFADDLRLGHARRLLASPAMDYGLGVIDRVVEQHPLDYKAEEGKKIYGGLRPNTEEGISILGSTLGSKGNPLTLRNTGSYFDKQLGI